uniref:Uncharacterized protein n=1 Tax=Anguilla anguilla TaxID=7936 RepID=A0A0E9T3Q9_ANGAN
MPVHVFAVGGWQTQTS